MQRFKNILLVLSESDLSGPAAQRAIKLARLNSARITIIDVVPIPSMGRSLLSFSEKFEDLKRELIIARSKELEALANDSMSDLDTYVSVLCGKPFIEIIRFVGTNGCDLVVKSVDTKKPFASAIFGSTDLRLLRKCPCPVWLVKPDDSAETRKILAAVELEALEDDNVLDELNRKIVEIASSLAYREGGEIHIVNAWLVFEGQKLAKKLSKHYEEDALAWVSEQRKSIKAAQEALSRNFSEFVERKGMTGLKYSFHFLEGEAEEVIVDLTRSEGIDLVVMGTVARTDLAGFIVGNTSEGVISQIDSSVLAVKPSGFVSPVTPVDG